jgi:hypothetical protein
MGRAVDGLLRPDLGQAGCRRIGGCGQVFDGATLFDAHRQRGVCRGPSSLGLVPTRNGIRMGRDHSNHRP